MCMPIDKIIVTLLVGYLAGSAINFLADRLPSAYARLANNRNIRKVGYLLPYFLPDKTAQGGRPGIG